MNRQPVMLVMLLCLALGLLAACGGENPTATPVPPAATAVPATNTALPLTSTAVPATSTPALPSNTPVPPTLTAGPQPATAAEQALIAQALAAAGDLKSFHFIQVAGGSMMPQPRNIEGDYVAPDQLYAKGQMSGEQGEFLKAGTQSYKKDAQGTWVPWTDPSEQAPQTPQQVIHAFFAGVVPIAAVSDFQNTGLPETLDGVSTEHFAGSIPLSKVPGTGAQVAALRDLPPAGTIGVWIDPLTKTLHKVEIHLDTRPALAAAAALLATPGAATAVPDRPLVLTVSMTISRANDAAIRVPAAPAAGGPLPTATAAGAAPTQTPGAQPATAAEQALITRAVTGVAGLQSFHFTQMIAGSAFTQPWNIEGDYVAPDQEYSKGQLGGVQGAFLQVGTQSYRQDAQGNWTAWNLPGTTAPQTPRQTIQAFFTGLAAIVALGEFQNTGAPETLDGVPTQHFAGTIALGKIPGVGAQVAALPGLPPAGTLGVWIDPLTGNLHKIAVRLDTGPAMAAALAQLAAPGAPTAVPGPPYVFTVDMTISRQNDPAIHVPAPGAAGPGPTAAATPGPAGSTTTPVTIQLAAPAGHTSPQTALVLPGRVHVDLTLTSARDVVFFSFQIGAPTEVGLMFRNPDDAAGPLKVQILDPSGQTEIDAPTLQPGSFASRSLDLSAPGAYLIKITAAGLTRIPKTPVTLDVYNLTPLATDTPAPAETPTPGASVPTTPPASGGAAGPTPTQTLLQVSAAGHNSPQTALALPGPAHIDLALTSAKDVVYFSLKTDRPAEASFSFYNPPDAVGQLQWQVLDPSGQQELNADKLDPGARSAVISELSAPGVYLIKITAAGLTTVPKTAVPIDLTGIQ